MRAKHPFLAVLLLASMPAFALDEMEGIGIPAPTPEPARTEDPEITRAFLDRAAAEPGAIVVEPGLVVRTLQYGVGEMPGSGDAVTVHYTGWLADGTVFDSSRERGSAATFRLTQVIPCWTRGVQRMRVGEIATLTCGPDVAYGERGVRPKIPGGAALQFEVELLSIQPVER